MGRTTSILTTAEIQAVEYLAALDASKAVVTDASGLVISSTATATEVGYLSGVTSAIQTQLNSKPGLSDNNTWTGTNTFQNTVTYDTRLILSGNQSFTAASGNAYMYHSNTLGLVMYGEGSTYDVLMANKSGGTVFAVPTGTVNMEFAGNATYTSSVTQIGTGTSDGSDTKAITIFGGGAYGTTRGSGIAVIGNEYPSVGGDLELIAGDSATSGMIKFYVGNGSGNPVLAGSFARATQQFNCYGNMVTTGSVISVYNMVNTSASTTLTNFTQAITNAGVLINTEYTANAYTSGIFWATSNDNATKPKAGIFIQETGLGTYLFLGTSNLYATGIVNTVTVGPDGDIAANRYSAVSTATTQNILASFGDSLTTGRGLYVYSNSGSSSSRSLMEIHNDSSAATGTTTLLIKQDANYLSQYIIHGGSTIGAFYIGADSLGAGGYCANFVSNSSDASSRWLFGVVNQHTSATGTGLFAMEQNAVTSTNYRKYARYFAGSGTYITFWTADNVSPSGVLTGSSGDICYSTNGNVYRCTSGTSWTAL